MDKSSKELYQLIMLNLTRAYHQYVNSLLEIFTLTVLNERNKIREELVEEVVKQVDGLD